MAERIVRDGRARHRHGRPAAIGAPRGRGSAIIGDAALQLDVGVDEASGRGDLVAGLIFADGQPGRQVDGDQLAIDGYKLSGVSPDTQ